MIPELGNFSLILAFCLASLMVIIPMAGAITNNQLWMSLCRPLSSGIWVFMIIGWNMVFHPNAAPSIRTILNAIKP